MAMQPTLLTINGLSVELGYDRRTLAKWLDTLPPAETAADGTKRWLLRDVLMHLENRKAVASRKTTGSTETQLEINHWIGHKLVPTVFGSSAFIGVFTGALRTELHLSKPQALRAYMLVLLALVAELERAGIGSIELPPLAARIAEEGIDAVVADWPDTRKLVTISMNRQPVCCAICERELLASLPADRDRHAAYCTHNQTLAIVKIIDGQINRWRLIGPVTEDEAQLTVELSADLRREILTREKKLN